MTPLISRMIKFAPDPELAHWFDTGGASIRPGGHVPDAEMFKLPYPVCCIVGTQANGTAFVLRLQTSDTAKSMSVTGIFDWNNGQGQFGFDPLLLTLTDQGIQASTPEGEPPENENFRPVLRHIEDFLLALEGGQTAYVPKARPSFINSKRAAKGKGPVLFDWHTVTIGPRPEPHGSKGGTHASPRLHDRRGHWRTTASGKRVWVKDCKVGDASRGVVFKDYKIKEAA